MKKFLSIVLACLLWVSCGALLTGCKKVTVKSIVLKSGIEKRIIKDGIFSTTDAVVTVTYSNKEKEDVTSERLQFSDIDTSVVGKQNLTITYTYDGKDYTSDPIEITIVATDSELYTIVNMESEVCKSYDFNRGEKTDKTNNFKVHDEPLTVGTDNFVDFEINATGLDDSGNKTPTGGITNVRTSLTVKEKHADGTYQDVNDLSSILTKDDVTNHITFKSGAVGREFALTFKAATVDNIYEEAQTQFTAYVKVEEGFNVYDAQDMSLFDNQRWQEATRAVVRQKYGLAVDYYPDNIYLLRPITIKKEDLPSHYFYEQHKADDPLYGRTDLLAWGEERDAWLSSNHPLAEGEERDPVAGSTINYYGTGIYHREVFEGQKFSFNGNYFMIDIQKFPLAVYQNDSNSGVTDVTQYASSINGLPYGPYQSLFFIGNRNASGVATSQTVTTAKAEFKNTQLIGNGQLTDDMRKSGGLMMLKNAMVDFYGYNTLANNFSIGYFFDEDHSVTNHKTHVSEYVVDNCKGYGYFESLFYMNNPAHAVIKNSEFVDAGGPALIVDHDNGVAKDEEKNIDTAPQIDIVNTTLSSLVNSQSPWFKTFANAETIVGMLQSNGEKLFDNSLENTYGIPHSNKTINQTINATNGFTGEAQVIDLIALMKTNGANIMNINKLSGYIRVYETEAEYDAYCKTHIITTHGLDFYDTTKRIFIPGGSGLTPYSISEHVLNHEDGVMGDVVMQSNNGGFVNLASVSSDTPNPNLFVSSLVYGANAAAGISGILTQLGQTYNGDFADMKYHVDQMSANLLTRFNAYYAGEETKLNSFFNTLAGTEHPELAQAVGTLKVIYPFGVSSEAWNLLNKDQKYKAIVDYLTGIETNNLYATGNYLNLYLFNGMGAMLKLYDRAAA